MRHRSGRRERQDGRSLGNGGEEAGSCWQLLAAAGSGSSVQLLYWLLYVFLRTVPGNGVEN